MRKGFTLIEILIVISILGILTTFLVAATRTSDKNILIYADQSKLVGVIARAKSLSIETFKERSICGYGVHFEPAENRYFVYSYTDPSAACRLTAHQTNNTDYRTVSEYPLAEGIVFSTADGGENALPDNLTDVFFKPPRPTIYFSPALEIARIPLKIRGGETIAVMTVSYAGQITIE